MDGLLLTVTAGVHLLSAVVWIGGIFFILYVALPVAEKTIDQPGKIMGPLSKRFIPLANVSIFLIIATGIIMSVASHEFAGLSRLFSLREQYKDSTRSNDDKHSYLPWVDSDTGDSTVSVERKPS